MKEPSPAAVATIRRLLACEFSSTPDHATAAARVCEKIYLLLSPMVGFAGVQALFARSVSLTRVQHPCLAEFVVESVQTETPANQLLSCLQGQTPEIAESSAVALFATFFALLATFIGEPLTAQVLQGAWLKTKEQAPSERKK
jgi:hypothetical protein